MAVDPVCEMTVEPDQAAAKGEYQAVAYYFSSDACHKIFTADPGNSARKTGAGKPNTGGMGRSCLRPDRIII